MKTKIYNNFLDYINSDLNNWSYVELKDFENAKDKKVKVYLDKQDNEIDVVLISKQKGKNKMKANKNLDFNNLKKETIDIGMKYEDALLFYVRYYSHMSYEGKLAVEKEISRIAEILDNKKENENETNHRS